MLDCGQKPRCSYDVVYLDFSKAFDSVVHRKLIVKLKAYGITGNLLKWIAAFLSERVQRVKIGAKMSTPKPVISGVPQGSVLGPLLFLIYVNDICDLCLNTNVHIIMFADDTKLFAKIEHTADLQYTLNSLNNWSKLWQLKLAPQKSAVLSLGRNNSPHTYTIGDSELSRVSNFRDLGDSHEY